MEGTKKQMRQLETFCGLRMVKWRSTNTSLILYIFATHCWSRYQNAEDIILRRNGMQDALKHSNSQYSRGAGTLGRQDEEHVWHPLTW